MVFGAVYQEHFFKFKNFYFSHHPNRVSATETVDSGSISNQVEPKTIKIGIYGFLLDIQQLKGQCEASIIL